MLYLAGCILIQNEKLSLSRHHFIVRLSHHGGDVVTVETGAVDYILSFNLSRCCEDPLDFPLFRFNAGYLSFQLEFHPVGTGVFCIGLHQNKWVNDTLPRNVQTALYLRIQVGLHFKQFFPSFELYIVHMVTEGLLLNPRQLLVLLFGDGW